MTNISLFFTPFLLLQVTIGHGALITSATIGNRVLVGQGSIIQEGAEIGNNVVIAAGAVVLPGTYFFSTYLHPLSGLSPHL